MWPQLLAGKQVRSMHYSLTHRKYSRNRNHMFLKHANTQCVRWLTLSAWPLLSVSLCFLSFWCLGTKALSVSLFDYKAGTENCLFLRHIFLVCSHIVSVCDLHKPGFGTDSCLLTLEFAFLNSVLSVSCHQLEYHEFELPSVQNYKCESTKSGSTLKVLPGDCLQIGRASCRERV